MPNLSSESQDKQYPPNAFKREKKFESFQSLNQNSPAQNKTKKSQSSARKYQSNSEDILQDNKIRQDDAESQQSEQDELQKQAQDIVNEMRKKQQNEKANNKVVVGSGFSFDITQFFKFQKKKKLDSNDGDLFSQISGSMLAWIILLYSVINAAMIPSWIMNIAATKFVRISWRFLLQSFMIFPFVLYERRSGNQQVKKQYTFSHILKPEHLKKVYISSIATTIWFTCILTVFEWTYVSHGIMLGSLSNFFLSIHRSITKSEHNLEPGGRYCVILGIILVIYDTYRLDTSTATDYERNVIDPFYLNREWYTRVIADLVALFVSFTLSRISRYTSDMKSHYPPYLSMLLVHVFMTINMAFSTYFFNGLTFDTDSRYGYFSIFSNEHFAGFMYMSIVLGFGMFVSSVMISKLFPDPILPALAMTLDPVLATILLEWSGIQTMPKAYSFIGYLFIVPGLLLILVGQCLYQRSKAKQNENKDIVRSQQILKQLRQVKLLKTIEQKKTKLKRAKTMIKDLQQQHKSGHKAQGSSLKKQDSKSSLCDPLIEPEHKIQTMERKGSLDSHQLHNMNKKDS